MPRPILTALLLTTLNLLSPTHARADDAKRTLQHTTILAAPIEDVWQTLTTAEGWKQGFGVAHAEVDLRVGGTIRTHYDPKGTIGDPNTIVHTILAYEPGRMIASKCTSVPATSPDALRHISASGWSVIRLDPLTPDRTQLTLTGMGYGDTELDHQAYDFFKQGNDYSLKKLQAHFADPADDESTAAAEKLARRLLGDWAFTNTRPDGTTFRGTTSCVELFDGKVLHAVGSLGNDKGLHPHSHFLAARDPRSGAMKVWNFNERGDYTEGRAVAKDDDTLVVDWHTWSAGSGTLIPYRVVYTFKGSDTFHLEVSYPNPEKPGEMQTLVEVDYQRVTANTEGH